MARAPLSGAWVGVQAELWLAVGGEPPRLGVVHRRRPDRPGRVARLLRRLRRAGAQVSAVQHDRRDADEVVSRSRGPRREAYRPQPGQLAGVGNLAGRPDGGDAPAGLAGLVQLVRLERDHGAAGGGSKLAAAVGPDHDVTTVE